MALTTQESAEKAAPPGLPVDGEVAVHCAGIRRDGVLRQFLVPACLRANRERPHTKPPSHEEDPKR